MATVLNDGDKIILSRLDVKVLIALLRDPMHAYRLARQCEEDGQSERLSIRGGALYHSLKSLLALYLIQLRHDAAGTSVYEITSVGQSVLDWELQTMRKLLDLAKERAQNRA